MKILNKSITPIGVQITFQTSLNVETELILTEIYSEELKNHISDYCPEGHHFVEIRYKGYGCMMSFMKN